MRLSKFFVGLFLLGLLGGLVFFKDSLNKAHLATRALEAGHYLDYSDQNLKSSEKLGRTVLFFAATTWCSNCAALDSEIKKRQSEIPADTTILKVDYDHDSLAKTKYAVAMQTTLVLLDSSGKEIKRWIGTDFDNLVQNLN